MERTNEGLMLDADLGLFRYTETAQEAWDHICQFHAERRARRRRR
jgi:hypothetical protein